MAFNSLRKSNKHTVHTPHCTPISPSMDAPPPTSIASISHKPPCVAVGEEEEDTKCALFTVALCPSRMHNITTYHTLHRTHCQVPHLFPHPSPLSLLSIFQEKLQILAPNPYFLVEIFVLFQMGILILSPKVRIARVVSVNMF